MSKLDSEVLKLNKNWSPISVISARQAFSDASAEAVTFLRFTDGYPTPYRIEDWLKIEAEDGEDYVTTSRMHELKRIAIPRVIICTTFNKIITREQPCTPDNLLKRYGHKDAVSGKPLERTNFSREHVKPRSKGGSGGWENLVPMDKRLNSSRGNKSYRSVGLKKPRILAAPRPLLPINSIVNKKGYPEWDPFHIPRPESS